MKNRDVTAADEILGSVSLGHPSDTVHSPESDIKNLAEDDEQPVIPNPVTEESKMSEGVGKLPEPRLSNSGTNEVNAKVHAENKPVLEETLVAQNSLGNGKKNDSDACFLPKSSSHDASDSFENIEISNKGKEKDFNVSEIDDQNSLLQDADTEKNDVSKSLKSNNGKDIFAPENDALDPIPPDTDRFETKDVCLASLGVKTDRDTDGVFTPLESENGDDPENNGKNYIISNEDDESATENRHTKMMGKHGFDPLLAPQNERADQYHRDADAFERDFSDYSEDSILLPTDDSTDTTYQVIRSTITPENVNEVQKGIVHPLSSSASFTAKQVDKVIGTLSSGDEDNNIQSRSDSICSELNSVALENKAPDSMELYRLRKDYSGNMDSSMEVSATTGSSEEDGIVSEEAK